MDVKERIQQYLDYKGINTNQLETSIGVSKSYWRKTKSISANIVVDICRIYTDLNLEWLFRGTGDMIIVSEKQNQVSAPSNASAFMIPFDEFRKVVAEKDEVIKDQAHKIGMLEHELQLFTSKKQTALGMENVSTAAKHQRNIPEAE